MTKNNAPLTSKQVDREYAYWRTRLTYALIFGYASFYLVRQNVAIAAPSMFKEFGFTKAEFGWAFSAFSIIYGLFKFISGAVCDRSSARYFLPIGLFCAAICSLVMGLTDSIMVFGVMYALNACFQSMGWPSVTRSLTQWFSPKQLGTRWGIVNGSHQIGSVLILMGGAWLVTAFNWRYAFIVPSALCMGLAFLFWHLLRDTPQSMGLPSVEEKEGLIKKDEASVEENIPFKEMLFKHILPNKSLWCVCGATFFVYIIRSGFFCWAPTLIQETKGGSLLNAGFKTSSLEVAGLIAGIFAGWASGFMFSGRRGIFSFVLMIGLTISMLIFCLAPDFKPFLSAGMLPAFFPQWLNSSIVAVLDPDTLLWCTVGFFVYGPQTLTGLSGAESGSKKVAAAATGLTGMVGYLGGAIAGVGIGKIADVFGWDGALSFFVACAVLGGVFFLLAEYYSKKQKVEAASEIEVEEEDLSVAKSPQVVEMKSST
ncbi:MAG: hypothetical protein A2007_01475 [Verrucomicrobia bacterium GWC2_42_7]|nr:MAG: hypothetical protein A2007_01475 [Verrucomicrobia bacterium GWC2_42_7]